MTFVPDKKVFAERATCPSRHHDSRQQTAEPSMGSASSSIRGEQRFNNAYVSASGIYFETETPLAPGALLSFTIDHKNPDGTPLRMRCDAHIVRVEGLPRGRIGVGAEIYGFAIIRSPERSK